MMFSHPGFYGVVAESDGRIIGSNCLDERSPIAGVGPITVETARTECRRRTKADGCGSRRAPRNASSAGVRLLQAAFHNRSLSLYTKLGFDAREPISTMQGAAHPEVHGRLSRPCRRYAVRPRGLQPALHARFMVTIAAANLPMPSSRAQPRSWNAARASPATRLRWPSSDIPWAKPLRDIQALISAADSFGGPGILVPTRNAALFRWCLENGLRVKYPMTLMSVGMYQEPAGSFLPSVLF